MALDDIGKRKDAVYTVRWIVSFIPNSTIWTCHQTTSKKKAIKNKVSSVIVDVYQSEGTEKAEQTRKKLEKKSKIDEIRRFSSKKLDNSHDRCPSTKMKSEDLSKPSIEGENQLVSLNFWMAKI